MKRVFTQFALLLLLTLAPANAVIGALDDVPAATLLLPYFAVDLDTSDGLTTVVSVGNTLDVPVIVHFTLWTDLGVATLDWNVYLTGYDLYRLDLRELFDAGVLPPTSHNNPAVSPVGIFSSTSNPVSGVGPGTASCNAQLPLPNLPPILQQHIRSAHLGGPSILFGGLCSAIDHDDSVARGYLTMDVVRSCTLVFPSDVGYFADGGNGEATNENAIVGDFAYITHNRRKAEGHSLVHLEASSSAATTQPGQYTFYARYSGGADNREALPTTYWARYEAPKSQTGKSSLLYWRDSKQGVNPFSCSQPFPSPFPLDANQIVVFDDQENPDVPSTGSFSPAVGSFVPFSWAAGRVRIGGTAFPVPFDTGWMYLNLNNTVAGSQVPHEPLMQNWISTSYESVGGRYQWGMDAFPLDNAATGSDTLLPICDGGPDPAACE